MILSFFLQWLIDFFALTGWSRWMGRIIGSKIVAMNPSKSSNK